MLQDKRFAYGLLLALVIALPFILRTHFERDLLVMIGIFSIVVLSYDLIMSGMGQFSLGHHAFFGIGAYASALLNSRLGVTPFVGFLGAIACAAIAGIFIGYVALRAVRGVYLAIVTLGFSVILYLIVRFFWDFTGGARGLLDLSPPVIAIPGLAEMVFRSELSYYYLVLAFLLFTIYLISRWQRSRFGRAVIALRENEALASSIGIAPVILYTLAFALAAALAGLGGALYAHYVRFIFPYMFTMYYLLLILVMLFVGGMGTLGGPIVGTAIFIFAQQLLPSDEIGLVAFGIILLLCIIFMPRGVYPALVAGLKRLAQMLPRARKAEILDK